MKKLELQPTLYFLLAANVIATLGFVGLLTHHHMESTQLAKDNQATIIAAFHETLVFTQTPTPTETLKP